MKKFLAIFSIVAAVAIIGSLGFSKKSENHALATAVCNPNNQAEATCAYHGQMPGFTKCVDTGQGGTWATCSSTSVNSSSGVGTVSTRPILNWTPSAGATYYVVEISDSPDFSRILLSKQVSTNSYVVGN